ncbi:hypothetical protein ABZ759_30685 [Streptomyces sp. NPDC047860]|uniref:hypothetical protein n=1 Tax=Streptomyces sp. NPDC047860 TaxID=3155743 RepID=UPI0033FE9134
MEPLYLPRPFIGPLPEQWPDLKIPRWYAWWRLHEGFSRDTRQRGNELILV